MRSLPCDLPQPAAEDLMAALGVHGGVLVPTVTVAGQDEETQFMRLEIEPGDQTLYL